MTDPTDESSTRVTTKAFVRLAPDDPQPPPYCSPRHREQQLGIALTMTAAAAALTALAAVERYRFTSEALRLGAVSPAGEDAVAQHRTIAYIVVALVGLAAAALWLRWFNQVYGNLPSLGASRTRLSRSSAVVCCALPVSALDYLESARSGSLVEVGAAALAVATVLLTARLAAALTARQETRAAHLEDAA